MATPSHLLVRIKPTNKKESHSSFGYTIRKTDGWCRIPYGVATELAKEKMNDLNPESSPDIFDVMPAEDAKAMEELARPRNEPAGTVDSPKEKMAADLPPDHAGRKRRQAQAEQ
jgi:hypothetical protein